MLKPRAALRRRVDVFPRLAEQLSPRFFAAMIHVQDEKRLDGFDPRLAGQNETVWPCQRPASRFCGGHGRAYQQVSAALKAAVAAA
jgi:hypothetical protein